MFIKLSNGNLLNLDLVSDVIFDHLRKQVTLQGYGINMHVSTEAYDYFMTLPADQIVDIRKKAAPQE